MARRGRVRVELIGEAELRAKISRMGDDVRKANSQAARAGAEPIRQEANSRAPGPNIMALQSKIRSTEDRAEVDIGPDKAHWYYAFAEYGAKEHEIKGKVKEFLAFAGRNGLVITRSVKHPGVIKRPFLHLAMRHNEEAARKRAGEVFLREINKETI